MNAIVIGACWCICAIFVVSLSTKNRSRSNRLAAADAAGKLAPWMNGRAALALSEVYEALTVIAIALPTTRGLGLASASLLLIVYSTSIHLANRRGASTECLCFGRKKYPAGVPEIVRNACATAVALSGLVALNSAENQANPNLASSSAIIGCLLAALLVLLPDLYRTAAAREEVGHASL